MNTRIHIISSGPRTGTTLLTEVMRVCFNIENVCDHEASICVSDTRLGGGNIILSKYPGEIDLVKDVLAINRHLYVVCLVRDPRDMVVSFHGAHPNIYWASLKYWTRFLTYYPEIGDHPRFILLKYEDLVREPDEVQSYLAKRIGALEFKNHFSQYHNFASPNDSSNMALKTMRPIEEKGIGNWKTHLKRVKQQITIHGNISQSLIEFGYEKTFSWETLLSEIQLVDYRTKTGEYYSKKQLNSLKTRRKIAITNNLLEKFKINPEIALKPLRYIYKAIFKMKKSH